MKKTFVNTIDDRLLVFLDNFKGSLYELIGCDDLEHLDFYTFDTLERLGHLINYKTKLIKRYLKYSKGEKNERI